MKWLKSFNQASTHTKIFWIVALSIGVITTGMSLYPYVWFAQHRSESNQ